MIEHLVGLCRKVYRSWSRNGTSFVAREALHSLTGGFRRFLVRRRKGGSPDQPPPSTFDQRFNLDTSDGLGLKELAAVTSPNWRHGFQYSATPESVVRDAIQRLPIRFDAFAFIDLGSGKGRVLLVAAQWPFHRIIGVEYCKPLHEAALKNIETYRRETGSDADIQSCCGDASLYQFSPLPGVVYLFNPFDANIMEKVAGNLVQSLRERPRPLYVIYHNPLQAGVLLRHGFVELADLSFGNTRFFSLPPASADE